MHQNEPSLSALKKILRDLLAAKEEEKNGDWASKVHVVRGQIKRVEVEMNKENMQ